jgi:membrane associated rhomboid family serine protease
VARRFRFSGVPGGGEADPWFRIGTLDVTTTMFVTLLSASMFVVYAIAPGFFSLFMLFPSQVWSGFEVWRIGTWPLSNDISLWSVISIFFFWYFGSQLESNLGRSKMANLLVWLTLTLGVLAVLFSLAFQSVSPVMAGLGTIQLVLILVFIAEYPHIQFMFNIPGWLIALVLVGINFLSLLGARMLIDLLNFVVGLGVAAVVARSVGLLRDYHAVPDLAFFRHRAAKPKQRRTRGSSGSVVSGPWAGSSSGQSYAPTSDRAKLDALLDKISEGGMDSLSKSELKQLETLRRRLRGE